MSPSASLEMADDILSGSCRDRFHVVSDVLWESRQYGIVFSAVVTRIWLFAFLSWLSSMCAGVFASR